MKKVYGRSNPLSRANAINGGADFILVGMFDWQIEENVKLAKRVIEATARSTTTRTRPWYGVAT